MGPLIEVTYIFQRFHIFLSTLSAFDELLGLDASSVMPYFRLQMLDRVRQRQVNPEDGQFDMAYHGHVRDTPIDSNYHFEYFTHPQMVPMPSGWTSMRVIQSAHYSGGRVCLTPRPTQAEIDRLLDRLVEDRAEIQINGLIKAPVGRPQARQVKSNVRLYLNSL